MKKIMFNDKLGLTDAVLNGTKTVTRRIITDEIYGESSIESNPPRIDEIQRGVNSKYIKSHLAKYKSGEVLAVAQRYQDAIDRSKYNSLSMRNFEKSAGWTNKMFVKASLMSHQIEIVDVSVERLQDITGDDCIKEGIKVGRCGNEKKWMTCYYVLNETQPYCTPHQAFEVLIDKVSGKGTWQSNPYVFRYQFKLIK